MPEQKDEYPKIRKVIFIIDKDRKYSFDVDQNISIYNLKMMIRSAASLGKVYLRIFHEGKEYTKNDPDLLDFLFPTLETVVFTITIDDKKLDDYDSLINLRLSKKYCSNHNNKYPYYFCYKCNKSICSDCILSNEHIGHRDKITVKYFPSLVKILKEIENKLLLLIDTFIQKEKKNFFHVNKNMISLKQNCEDGLDCLKDRICIEDMMLDDDIFITFDKKYKLINQEKNKIMKNIEEFEQFKNQLKIL